MRTTNLIQFVDDVGSRTKSGLANEDENHACPGCVKEKGLKTSN